MALQTSGAISLSDINVELKLSATATISLNDSAVRGLFGKPSGVISLSDGYGKSNALVLDFGTNNYSNLNLRSLADSWGFTNHRKVTFKFAGLIDASSTAVPAIEIGSFPAGTHVTLIIYGSGQVRGRGGAGGSGQLANGTAAVAGGAGGPAIKATYSIPGGCTIELQGSASIRPGGGGGGGGARGYIGGENMTYYAGGKGGNGWSVGVGQTAGSAGSGGGAGTGGSGGGSGGAGGTGVSTSWGSGAGGGAGGAAMINSGYATKVNWVAGSNYFGALA